MKYFKYLAVVFFVCSYFFLLQPLTKPVHAALAGFNSDCLEVKDGRAVGDGAVLGHTAELLFPTAEQRAAKGSQPPLPGKKTWVFVCIATTTGNKCTSGNPDIDVQIFGKRSDYDDLVNNKDYTTKNIGGVNNGKNPTTTTTDADPQFSNPPIYWFDEYIPAVQHSWLWLQEAVPVPDAGPGAGSAGAQQQATFDFVKALADSSKCSKIGWDPKGYVFDANTLYPVKGVSITISQKGGDGQYTDVAPRLGLSNPDISLAKSGQYSFYTPPGTYKLSVTSTNATLANIGTINPLYKKIFTLTNPTGTIYQMGNEITEVGGKVAISHIPVSVTDGSMLVKDLSVIMRKEERSLNEEILFTGILSHPDSIIKIVSTYVDKTGKVSLDTKSEMTDEVGEYNFSLAQSKSLGDSIVYLTKYDVSFSLNPDIYTNPGVQSPQNSFSGEVIPAFLNGVAYDEVGKPLASAIVGIYPSYSDNAMYYTSTDEKGVFTIGSQHIPQFHYSLRYKKSTGAVIEVNPSVFIKQNVAYFATNGISPFKSKQTTTIEEKKAQDQLNTITGGNSVPDMNKPTSSADNGPKITPKSQNNPLSSSPVGSVMGIPGALILIVLVIALIMIAVGLFVVMKSKQPQIPPPPGTM